VVEAMATGGACSHVADQLGISEHSAGVKAVLCPAWVSLLPCALWLDDHWTVLGAKPCLQAENKHCRGGCKLHPLLSFSLCCYAGVGVVVQA
jgi:hypothetical protein